ncbi:MAG: hypothetical protein R2706_13315 [Acidimicrobiales bacterium]
MAESPAWKRAFDEAEKRLSPSVTRALATPEIIEALTIAIAVRRRMLEDIGSVSRRVLHFWNLPAGTDVRKVSLQIADLERQLRSLNRQLDEMRQGDSDASTT